MVYDGLKSCGNWPIYRHNEREFSKEIFSLVPDEAPLDFFFNIKQPPRTLIFSIVIYTLMDAGVYTFSTGYRKLISIWDVQFVGSGWKIPILLEEFA